MKGCKYCQNHKSIDIHRAENVNTYEVFMFQHFTMEKAAIFLQNTKGMPAYIEINFCPFCGEKLFVKERPELARIIKEAMK